MKIKLRKMRKMRKLKQDRNLVIDGIKINWRMKLLLGKKYEINKNDICLYTNTVIIGGFYFPISTLTKKSINKIAKRI